MALDLPTQCGHDPTHPLAVGEVGRVGVPLVTAANMAELFAGFPLEFVDVNFTINADAAVIYAFLLHLAGQQGVDLRSLRATTQGDPVKEIHSRGTYIFPPGPALRLSADYFVYALQHTPFMRTFNGSCYHPQERGAEPAVAVAMAMATALQLLDRVSTMIPPDQLPQAARSVAAFFGSSDIRVFEQIAAYRAAGRVWGRIMRDRFGVEDPKFRRMSVGVQVSSWNLQPLETHQNVARATLEALAAVLGGVGSMQLPPPTEALGLPTEEDQGAMRQVGGIVIYETGALEVADPFAPSSRALTNLDEARRHLEVLDRALPAEGKTREAFEALARNLDGLAGQLARGSGVMADLVERAEGEIDQVIREIEGRGGAWSDAGLEWTIRTLNASLMARTRAVLDGQRPLVGFNVPGFEPKESARGEEGRGPEIDIVDPRFEAEMREQIERHMAGQNRADVARMQERLRGVARGDGNIMPTILEAASSGLTLGQMIDALRDVWGGQNWRPPTGISEGMGLAADTRGITEIARRVSAAPRKRIIIAKPGLDGHDAAAVLYAMLFKQLGFEVIYVGIRQTSEAIVQAAEQEGVDLVAISILSGAHLTHVQRIADLMRARGMQNIPILVGGTIPKAHRGQLEAMGVKLIFTAADRDPIANVQRVVDLLLGPSGKGEFVG